MSSAGASSRTLGHRKVDPLYGIRRTLQIGAEHLTEKQASRLDARLTAGDPNHAGTLAYFDTNGASNGRTH